MEIIVYSKDDCPYCEAAKRWFKIKGLAFTEVKMNNLEERQRFYAETGDGVQSVPQIFIVKDGVKKRIGGYTELMANQNKFLSKQVSVDNKDF
jgi:glutaredoxin 3